MEKSHVNFKLIRCGLFIHPLKPFLAASPDSLASCDCCGIGTVEVKCPYCVLQDGNDLHATKYLKEDEEGVVTLNREHDYFYQVRAK